MRCELCFHHCILNEGSTGFCRARINHGGKNLCASYGRLTALSMDPIEKKPFACYYPGSWILSVGSYGCNLSCPFCQNSSISMCDEHSTDWRYFPAEKLAQIALEQKHNLGLAFTYNEPLISYEYILDCARILKPYGKKIVLVTNGTISLAVLEKLIPYVDAMNVDLKGDEDFYRELNGSYESTWNTISFVYDKCHLEVTTLLIPGKNDTDAFMERISRDLSALDPEIPLHLSRYFPRFRYNLPPTGLSVMKHLKSIAEKHLDHVFLGNI